MIADVQAPQRERVSLVVRGSVLLQSTGDALKTDSSWKRKIKGNNLESIPRLLWLLEPKIVFAHAKVRARSSPVHACHRQSADTWPCGLQTSCRGQYAESQYCQGMFLEGYHRGGGRVSCSDSIPFTQLHCCPACPATFIQHGYHCIQQ